MIQNAHICQLIKINGITVKMHLSSGIRYFNLPWLHSNVIYVYFIFIFCYFFTQQLNRSLVLLAAHLLVVTNVTFVMLSSPSHLFFCALTFYFNIADSCALFMPCLLHLPDPTLSNWSICPNVFIRVNTHVHKTARLPITKWEKANGKMNWWMLHIRMVERKANGRTFVIVFLVKICLDIYRIDPFYQCNFWKRENRNQQEWCIEIENNTSYLYPTHIQTHRTRTKWFRV